MSRSLKRENTKSSQDFDQSHERTTTNQKKKLPSQEKVMISTKKHKKWKGKLILNKYMESFIKKASQFSFICLKCEKQTLKKTGKKDIYCENLYFHILSDTHFQNTLSSEENDYNKLKKLIDDLLVEKKRRKRNPNDEETNIEFDSQENKEIQYYLSFLSFLISERLSYAQISKISLYLQNLAQENKLNFLSEFSFNPDIISKVVTRCFRPALLEDVTKELASSNFSFTIDTSTMVGESLCAIKAKYWVKQTDPLNGSTFSELKNKIISLTSIKESSDASTMLKIVKSRLLTEDLIPNFVGLSHDNANALASEDNGLVGLLRKEIPQYFYDLPDPAHCTNLALKHSLKVLPQNMIDFIDEIHHYFSFPQRKALLKKVQEKSENPPNTPLLLKKYVPTRWTSLGGSLERLLVIWEYLKEYMNHIIYLKKGDGIKKIVKLYFQLNNNVFHLKIILLEQTVSKINALYKKFQNNSFNIGCLKTEIKLCFESILKLVCKPEKFDTNFEEILKIKWDDMNTHKSWFLQGEDFINNLINKIDSKYAYLKKFDSNFIINFVSIFHNFIGKLLVLLTTYLPFRDNILDFSSFIELKDKLPVLEDKLLGFNKMFKIVSESELKNQAFSELLRLRDQGFDSFNVNPQDNILDIWRRIEKTGKYPYLVKFFYFSQILPTSSSDVEQEFSIIKLFKSEQRNSLSEEGLEGLLLIHQNEIGARTNIPPKAISLFKELKEEMNSYKNGKRNRKRSYENALKESKMEVEMENEEGAPGSYELKKLKTNNLEEYLKPGKENVTIGPQGNIETEIEQDISKKKVKSKKIIK